MIDYAGWAVHRKFIKLVLPFSNNLESDFIHIFMLSYQYLPVIFYAAYVPVLAFVAEETRQ